MSSQFDGAKGNYGHAVWQSWGIERYQHPKARARGSEREQSQFVELDQQSRVMDGDQEPPQFVEPD